ncbi:MAG: ABC-2 transporter permease [Blautia sp.]|jgi:hypothetical protein
MKGLFLKDYYGGQQLWKQYVGLTVLVSLFALLMKSASYPLMMGMIMSINMVLSLLTIDEKGGWAYLLGTPVGRRTMIKEKYVFCLLLETVMLVGCSLVSVVATIMYRLDWREFFLYVITAFAYFFFTNAIIFPVNIKIGVEVGRFVSTGIFILPAAVLFVAVMLLKKNGQSAEMDLSFACILALVALVFTFIMWAVSYLISVKIFLKKEIQ